MLAVKIQDQVNPFAVQQRRNIAGNHIIHTVIHRIQIVIGHRLTVNGKPCAVIIGQKAVPFTLIGIIHTKVNKTVPVVIEHIHFQGGHQIPLFLVQCYSAVFPDQTGRIKVIVQDVFSCCIRCHAASHKQIQNASGGSSAASAIQSAQQFGQTAGGVVGGISALSEQASQQILRSVCTASVIVQ